MFEEIKNILDESDNIYIVGHKNPDGDCIGSTYSLCLALKKYGKNTKVIMPSFSDSFDFLPNINTAVSNVEEESYDLLFALDCSNPERLAITDEDYNKAKKVVMIDHHEISAPFGDARYIDSTRPAAAEIIYNFIEYLNIDIDKEIATYIYTGLMTDTGSFNYESTKSSTLVIASKLLEKEIEFAYICKRLNDTVKESKLKLLAKTIDNMEVFYNGKLRYSFVDYETIKSLGLTDEETEGMSNQLRKVDGTEVAIYVREKEDGTFKVSMRSVEYVDVSEIAIKFDGGGHKRAAGYTIIGNLQEAKEKLIDLVGVMLK